jgi:hypothetical protein
MEKGFTIRRNEVQCKKGKRGKWEKGKIEIESKNSTENAYRSFPFFPFPLFPPYTEAEISIG